MSPSSASAGGFLGGRSAGPHRRRRHHLIDLDMVAESNTNRQIQASAEVHGRPRSTPAERIRAINPWCAGDPHRGFRHTPENVAALLMRGHAAVIDAYRPGPRQSSDDRALPGPIDSYRDGRGRRRADRSTGSPPPIWRGRPRIRCSPGCARCCAGTTAFPATAEEIRRHGGVFHRGPCAIRRPMPAATRERPGWSQLRRFRLIGLRHRRFRPGGGRPGHQPDRPPMSNPQTAFAQDRPAAGLPRTSEKSRRPARRSRSSISGRTSCTRRRSPRSANCGTTTGKTTCSGSISTACMNPISRPRWAKCSASILWSWKTFSIRTSARRSTATTTTSMSCCIATCWRPAPRSGPGPDQRRGRPQPRPDLSGEAIKTFEPVRQRLRASTASCGAAPPTAWLIR